MEPGEMEPRQNPPAGDTSEEVSPPAEVEAEPDAELGLSAITMDVSPPEDASISASIATSYATGSMAGSTGTGTGTGTSRSRDPPGLGPNDDADRRRTVLEIPPDPSDADDSAQHLVPASQLAARYDGIAKSNELLLASDASNENTPNNGVPIPADRITVENISAAVPVVQADPPSDNDNDEPIIGRSSSGDVSMDPLPSQSRSVAAAAPAQSSVSTTSSNPTIRTVVATLVPNSPVVHGILMNVTERDDEMDSSEAASRSNHQTVENDVESVVSMPRNSDDAGNIGSREPCRVKHQRYHVLGLSIITIAIATAFGVYVSQNNKAQEQITKISNKGDNTGDGVAMVTTSPPTAVPTAPPSRPETNPPSSLPNTLSSHVMQTHILGGSSVAEGSPLNQTSSSQPTASTTMTVATQYTSKEISPGQFEDNTGESEEDDPIV
eukprot:CAMPEP_0183709242 /NCGR_PEP_ID=MMETSP0737-20130205/5337_1 /TAXON_ID=385413 /ORGANISM="Thalassiosira miniscula, Strain CCMP1093" /LENGTH=438 /DNA_ID=CAMNT_0025937295 /DNA_START=405 /DNA_END=1717 /DNA_ORIENTATION=-